METERVAAMKVHKVILFEKEKELAEQLRIASISPFKVYIKSLGYLCTQVRKLDVKVGVGKKFYFETINRIRPDAVIVATGITPIIFMLQNTIVNFNILKPIKAPISLTLYSCKISELPSSPTLYLLWFHFH